MSATTSASPRTGCRLGAELGGVQVDRYSLADFERREPLLWLGLAFAALVVLTGRWQGVRALVGLFGSLVLLVAFIVPAILEGSSPAAVALVGSLAIMLVTLTVTHGLGPKMVAAALGTAAALVLTLGLGSLCIELTSLTGLSSDEAVYLRDHRRRHLSRGTAARRPRHRRARCPRRPDGVAVVDRPRPPARESSARLRRPLPRGRLGRPGSRCRYRQHACTRLCGRVAAGAPHLQPGRHIVRRRRQQRGGRVRDRGNVGGLDRTRPRSPAHDGPRSPPRSPSCPRAGRGRMWATPTRRVRRAAGARSRGSGLVRRRPARAARRPRTSGRPRSPRRPSAPRPPRQHGSPGP